MNEAYMKLMLQQDLSEKANAAFYEKLETAQPKKRMNPVLRAAAIAACVLLLIPVTAWAVEYIFGIPTITSNEQLTFYNEPGIGMDIAFDSIEHHPITDFSEQLQVLDEGLVIYHDSWEDAEAYLGIDLLENTVCTDEETMQSRYFLETWEEPRRHCQGIYRVEDGQLFLAKVSAAYEYKNVTFVIGAEITADHPTISDKQLQQYHDVTIVYSKENDSKFETEEYMTEEGIPISITFFKDNGWTEYTAYFAVNDISYTVSIVGSTDSGDESYADINDKAKSVFMEVLEGFTLE